MGSHLGSQASSHGNISLLEIFAKLSTGRLVSKQIAAQNYLISTHGDHQDQFIDFGGKGSASQAAKRVEVKWLPVKVQKVKDQQLYTITQVCSKLAISKASLYRLIHNHEIACIKIGRSSRISEQALERFVSARTQAVYDAWS